MKRPPLDINRIILESGNLWSGAMLDLFNDHLARVQAAGEVTRDRKPFTGGEEYVCCRWADDAMVAWAVFYQPEDYGKIWLDVIFVEPKFRRLGLGMSLLMKVMIAARERGLAGVSLGTGCDNSAMQALARQAGFASDHLVMTARLTS